MQASVLALVLAMIMYGCLRQEAGSHDSAKIQPQKYGAADVETALERARSLVAQGKYEEALELYVWYHKNALKYDEAQYGVRLSFALGGWAELNKLYPPALHELRLIRKDTFSQYKKDPTDSLIFLEVMSIDFALDDLKSAKSLFYLGRKNGVDRDVLMIELDRVLETGDLEWAKDVIGDPSKKLDEIERDREESITALVNEKDIVASLDGMYSRQIANILQAVSKVNGPAEARRLQKKALAFLNTTVVRDALK